MKEISLFIRPEDFSKVVGILRKNNVGGITFFETNGSGRTKHDPVPEKSSYVYDRENGHSGICKRN